MSASSSRPTSSRKNIRAITSGSRKTHGRCKKPLFCYRLASPPARRRRLTGLGSPTLRLVRIALYLGWTLALMPVQATGLVLRQSWANRLPRLYHRWCCRILGLQVRTLGAPVARRPALFVVNHISYIDIEVLGSLIEGSFVAKSEVARWPLF